MCINRATVYLGAYLWIVNFKDLIKLRITKWFLAREKNSLRNRQSCNLRNAQHVGLIYLERDFEFRQAIVNLSKHLKEELDVKSVSVLSYVDTEAKDTPRWLVKKLSSGYFCKSDLNWYSKPTTEVVNFTDIEFDILIDLELDPILPLKFVLKSSKAKMKVGPKQVDCTNDYDITIGRSKDLETDEMKVWQEQTERTLEFITQDNIR